MTLTGITHLMLFFVKHGITRWKTKPDDELSTCITNIAIFSKTGNIVRRYILNSYRHNELYFTAVLKLLDYRDKKVFIKIKYGIIVMLFSMSQ